MLGMTYEEYWQKDPWLVVCYREAHELRREMRNQEMYLQGMYNFEGVNAAIGRLMTAMSGKGGEPPKYPERPYPITKREQDEEKKLKIQATYAWIERSMAQQNIPKGKE